MGEGEEEGRSGEVGKGGPEAGEGEGEERWIEKSRKGEERRIQKRE